MHGGAGDARDFVARVRQGETETVDLKLHYDREAEGKAVRSDIAKDVMSLANVLAPGHAPAYLLLGVEEVNVDGVLTGVIKGLPPSERWDEARLRDAISPLINREPALVYTEIQVPSDDDSTLVWVGVVEISPGGRPFYTIADSGNKLTIGVAYRRAGTRNRVATPIDIEQWLIEDQRLDPAKLDMEKRKLEIELERLTAEVTPHPHCVGQTQSSTKPLKIVVIAEVRNDGIRPFRVLSVDVEAVLVADSGRRAEIGRNDTVYLCSPGGNTSSHVEVSIQNMAALMGCPASSTLARTWATAVRMLASATCESDTGRRVIVPFPVVIK